MRRGARTEWRIPQGLVAPCRLCRGTVRLYLVAGGLRWVDADGTVHRCQ